MWVYEEIWFLFCTVLILVSFERRDIIYYFASKDYAQFSIFARCFTIKFPVFYLLIFSILIRCAMFLLVACCNLLKLLVYLLHITAFLSTGLVVLAAWQNLTCDLLNEQRSWEWLMFVAICSLIWLTIRWARHYNDNSLNLLFMLFYYFHFFFISVSFRFIFFTIEYNKNRTTSSDYFSVSSKIVASLLCSG